MNLDNNLKKISRNILAGLGILIFFSPLYIPLIYETRRLYYHWYEILIYIGSLAIIIIIFKKFDK